MVTEKSRKSSSHSIVESPGMNRTMANKDQTLPPALSHRHARPEDEAAYRIVLGRDTIRTLRQATVLVPRRRRGRKANVSTLFRWSKSGCRGVVLPTIQCGGTRCTSVEAMQWFFEALSEPRRSLAGSNRQSQYSSWRTPSQRRRESEAAGKRLEQMGA
jgi:hypothetical protein